MPQRQGSAGPLLRAGLVYARVVGVVFIIYGLLLALGNAFALMGGQRVESGVVFGLIILTGLVAISGGVLLILSIERPSRFGSRLWRATAVGLMILSTLLPTTLTSVVFLLGLTMIPFLWIGLGEGTES